MSIEATLSAAVSSLDAQSRRVAVAADNVANVRTEGYRAADATTVSRDPNRGGGVSVVIRRDTVIADHDAFPSTTDLARETVRLIQAETAYRASLKLVETAQDLTDSLLDVTG